MGKVCPVNFFCMNTETFFLIAAVTVAVVIYIYNELNKKQSGRYINNFINYTPSPVPKQNRINPFDAEAPVIDDIKTKQYLINKEHERIVNPLVAPERSYPYRSPGLPINIPTRGESGPYSQVGTLTSEDSAGDPVILPLYGKPLYPGSNNWLYYCSTDKLPSVKLPIRNNDKDCLGDQGCKEIQSGDNITVDAYKDKTFTTSIYNIDKLRYIPYVV